MTAGPQSPWDDEELEPRRVWTAADRWRLAAWVLVFGGPLGIIMLAPVGDGELQRADASADIRTAYWIAVLVCTVVGSAIGAAAAATKQRWAIVPPLAGILASWAAFAIAMQAA